MPAWNAGICREMIFVWEMHVMRMRRAAKGFIITAFGIGLFLAYCFPSKFIIISLAVILVAAGIFIIKA